MGSEMIAALFVQRDGVYWDLPGVDPWDEERDARKYDGPWPVVAHPPCARWSMLAGLVEKRYGYKKGNDGGCFASALDSVRKWGGVLEHPAWSCAWPTHGLPRPTRRWNKTINNEWTCEVDQAAYGHKAQKRTWLLYVGTNPPPSLIWTKTKGTHQVSGFRAALLEIPKKERAVTPLAFRDVLISMARSCRTG